MKTTLSEWQLNDFDLKLIDIAFQEDLGLPFCDITSDIIFPNKNVNTSAVIISKHPTPIVFCGLPILGAVLKRFDAVNLKAHYEDGDLVLPGDRIMTLKGNAYQLLMIERTLLNFLQHLSAIATLTKQFVDQVKHTSTKILDTRKTLPGFRHLDKYAVACGGGVNHRMGLYDAVMIKDTHIDALGGMEYALDALPVDLKKRFPVIVEVRTIDELSIVLEKGLTKMTRLLLDNMSLDVIKECVTQCNKRIPTEASGNMDLNQVADVAECGVDFISVGKLTHSAGNVNLSMLCE